MNRDIERLRVFTTPVRDSGRYNATQCLTFYRCEPAEEIATTRGSSGAIAPDIARLRGKEFDDQNGLLVHLPSDFVEKHLVEVAGTRFWRLPESHNGLQRLVFACVEALQQETPHLPATDLQKATTILGDLLVLALGQVPESQPAVSPVRSATLMRAKRFIRSRCQFASLTPKEVARENGVSLRYLHNLFRDEGQTVGQYIMYERLRKARWALEVGSPLTTSVSAVCFSSGFTNLSHFSTAFKRAFSVSPIDVLRNRKCVYERS